MKSLEKFETCDLVKELKGREGVETKIAELYQDIDIKINGPAIVLIVTD
ncbi:BC1881 family protein [Anaeromassilibacillus sp. SJQ-1]